jgi:decaprenylphospho-beta-D-ribofuranose 2-oxidase
LVRRLDRRGTVARGLGRSYGDAALNAKGQVLGMTRLDRYLGYDERTGVLTCEAGVSLEQIVRDFAPRGWFPLITPGTKFVTVGGCIANDVHGKAHHVQGSFSTCVDSMRVLLASGDIVTASRTEHEDLFWATFGGMGLLGIVLDVTLQLRRIETTYFRQRAIAVSDLRSMLEAFEENDADYPYSVAYVDPVATGPRLGSGVLTVGDHAALDELPRALSSHPRWVADPAKLTVPFELPEFALNPVSIRALNVVVKWVLANAGQFAHYEKFFYPLDAIGHWNRGYGRRGFTQYQFVVPLREGYERMRGILKTIVSSGSLPFLNVLKKLGREGGGILSFPCEGYTLAIDFPIRTDTAALIARLDAMVLDAGGRVYLGKDAFLEPSTFRAMYPQVDAWLRTKAKYDPDGVFVSDLARRVGLVSGMQ